MLKPFNELRKIDVLPHCDIRKGKNDKGKEIDIAYLNWAKCIDLLHEHGATNVYFTPLADADGSFVHKHYDTTIKERRCECYYVKVLIHIDDLEFEQDYPLMNGQLVVYADTINQLRISNAHARAFVKGVAIRTGLGFGLWADDVDTDAAADDLSIHNVFAIRERIERKMTAALDKGYSMKDISDSVKMSEKQINDVLEKYVNGISYLDRELGKL